MSIFVTRITLNLFLVFSALIVLITIGVVEHHLQSILFTSAINERFLSLPLSFTRNDAIRRLSDHNLIQGITRVRKTRPSTYERSLRNSRAGLCSCEDDFLSIYCCQRAIIGAYNMGKTAADELLLHLSQTEIDAPEIFADHELGRLFEAAFTTPLVDYRHVVVTRNWYDSILSGYLYHKTGRDCWRDSLGRPAIGWLSNGTNENWERRLISANDNPWWPPGNGRNLCRYLQQESEEVGLRVYTAWAMSSFMNPALNFRRKRLAQEKHSGWNRTIFLCYEDILHLDSTAIGHLYFWFFPNRTHQANFSTPEYHLGLPLNVDQAIREKMFSMIAKMDASFFDGSIAAGNAEFGCQGPKNDTVSNL